MKLRECNTEFVYLTILHHFLSNSELETTHSNNELSLEHLLTTYT